MNGSVRFCDTQNTIGMIFMLLFYHLFLTLFMWSYWRTIMTSVGRIPDQVSESHALSPVAIKRNWENLTNAFVCPFFSGGYRTRK